MDVKSDIPAKWKCLSGSWLKVIAMVSMLIDHTAYFLLYYEEGMRDPLFVIGKTEFSVYFILRTIGRLAFPLYCFLLVEGFIHTKNRLKYGINLLAFALISELPWNYAHCGAFLYNEQNVFFTLFFGYCGLCLVTYMEKHPLWEIVGVLAILGITFVFKADYGALGYAAILAMYFLRQVPLVRAVVGIVLYDTTWRAGLAFVPIALYNGERGFIRGRIGKYVCYAFYPVHMLVLGLLKFGLPW